MPCWVTTFVGSAVVIANESQRLEFIDIHVFLFSINLYRCSGGRMPVVEAVHIG